MIGQTAGSELARFLHDELWSVWKKDRKRLETKWEENRLAYLGAPSPDTWAKTEKKQSWQSETVLAVTRQKIVTINAVASEILFRGGDLAFGLTEPPEGAMEAALTPPAAERAQQMAIDEAEKRLKRQLKVTGSVEELRRCFLSALVYGSAYAKTYITEIAESRYTPQPDGSWRPIVRRAAAKAVAHKSVWSIWRDMETENLQEGRGIVEVALLSQYELGRYRGRSLYFADAISSVLASARNTAQVTEIAESLPHIYRDRADRYRPILLCEFWARVPRKIVERFEKERAELGDERFAESLAVSTESEGELTDEADEIEIFCVTANRELIGFARNTGTRPYYYMELEPILEEIGGRGVADNLRYHQKVLNGLVRAIEDNIRLSNRIILGTNRGKLRTNLEEALATESPAVVIDLDARTEHVGEAVQQFAVNPLVRPLLDAVELYMAFADLDSNVPRAEQGQQSATVQTAFELQQRLERSSRYMAQILARADSFHEAILADLHDFNMRHPDAYTPPGDWQVVVNGHRTYETQVLRGQRLLQLLSIIGTSPPLAQEVNLRWLVEEIVASLDLPVTRALLSEEEKLERQQAALVEAQARAQLDAAEAEKRMAMAERLRLAAQADLDELRLKKAELIGKLEGQRPRVGRPPGPSTPAGQSEVATPPGGPPTQQEGGLT